MNFRLTFNHIQNGNTAIPALQPHKSSKEHCSLCVNCCIYPIETAYFPFHVLTLQATQGLNQLWVIWHSLSCSEMNALSVYEPHKLAPAEAAICCLAYGRVTNKSSHFIFLTPGRKIKRRSLFSIKGYICRLLTLITLLLESIWRWGDLEPSPQIPLRRWERLESFPVSAGCLCSLMGNAMSHCVLTLRLSAEH